MNELIYPLSQMNNVRVEMNSEGNLWVRADKSKLIQALNNVVKNSIEASKSQQGIVSIHAYQADQLDVCIKICDNGCGMSGEELDKLGTPFYSTQNNGTGLGLMVTCKIIKAFDGKIDFKSEKGKGTEVSILMPMITNC
ncbi:ATP-binding protein [Paenibacillus elgii]|nr:ATP-binding protein [Paenibacillus elgii]